MAQPATPKRQLRPKSRVMPHVQPPQASRPTNQYAYAKLSTHCEEIAMAAQHAQRAEQTGN